MPGLSLRLLLAFGVAAIISLPFGLSQSIAAGMFGMSVGAVFLIRDRMALDGGRRKAVIASAIASGVICFGAWYGK